MSRETPPDSVWHTEVMLTRKARGIPFDSALVHRIITASTGDPRSLWCQPRTGVMLIQTLSPLSPDTFAGEASSVRQARAGVRFDQGTRVELSGVVCATICKKGHRRVPVEEKQLPGWVQTHLPGCHACVDSATVLTPAKGDHAGQQLTVSRAVFHAWATVEDTEAFAGMLVHGVGRGKRFGAGLVLARRTA